MTATSTIAPARHAPELLGQTVVVIGGSAGIGLETAGRARGEGADVILTARDPERLHRVGLELGAASIAAFDATDFERLRKFFDELPTPIDHVLVTGPRSLLRASGGVRRRQGTPGGLRTEQGEQGPAVAEGRLGYQVGQLGRS